MAILTDNAIDFTLPTNGDGSFTLSSTDADFVVLYFYPKDDTPGCTKEAIAFTALIQEFAKLNTKVVGISKDTAAKHDKFVSKHELDVILASDAESDVCEKYGTWVEKNMYGKKYMGVSRTTFLIGKDLQILRTWPKVKVPGHAEEVLEAVKSVFDA